MKAPVRQTAVIQTNQDKASTESGNRTDFMLEAGIRKGDPLLEYSVLILVSIVASMVLVVLYRALLQARQRKALDKISSGRSRGRRGTPHEVKSTPGPGRTLSVKKPWGW